LKTSSYKPNSTAESERASRIAVLLVNCTFTALCLSDPSSHGLRG